MTFEELKLSSNLLCQLKKLGFVEPTEIQHKAIPILLEKKFVDFHGQAQTGTGKTLAFGLPLLDKIDVSNKDIQALIVAPTRELVLQICESLEKFSTVLGVNVEPIYGGVSISNQIRALKRKNVHIIVGTPGRLNDHLRRGSLCLNNLTTLVLDEADLMLDMGFKEEVEEILSFVPSQRQIWLFSATVKDGINHIKRKHMKDVVTLVAGTKNIATQKTKQYICVTSDRTRFSVLRRFIDAEVTFYGFIFCPTKVMTSEIGTQLVDSGYNAGILHGDMNQLQRNEVIRKFKNKEYDILVATDVAARGIDVSNATHVINYSSPDDQESYIHRIGRTGRAGKEGVAITLISPREMRKFSGIQRKFKLSIQKIDIPSFEKIMEARIKRARAYLSDLSQGAIDNGSCDKLDQYIETLTHEQLRKIASNIVKERFMKHIHQDNAIDVAPANTVSFDNFKLKELLIPVGSDDHVKRADVVTFLTSSGVLQEEQIQKIRVIKRRTFVEIPSSIATSLINSLRYKKLAKRNVRIRVISH